MNTVLMTIILTMGGGYNQGISTSVTTQQYADIEACHKASQDLYRNAPDITRINITCTEQGSDE